MKSAYEIAMERLEKERGPARRLSEEQKAAISEIEKKYAARMAEVRLDYEGKAAATPPAERAELLARMAAELKTLEEKRDREKDAVWAQD